LAQGVAQVLWPLVADGRWDVDAVTGCGARLDQLPALVADREPVAEVDGVVLDGGAIDVMCERLVSGVGDDDVLVICGSTLIVMARLPAGTALPPSILGFPDETGALTTSAASNAGALFLDWVDRTVGRARGVAEPADVPVWTPYIRGERTPWQDPARRAAVNDLHLGHGPAALRRGAFEASAFVVRHLLELMGVEPRRLVAVGGGTRSSGWMQALADVNRAPVDAATEPEGAAIGAAFLARVSAGLADDLADAKAWARPTRRFEPDPAWVRPADARYRRFRDLVDPSAPTTPAAG
jgi:xylulokinase